MTQRARVLPAELLANTPDILHEYLQHGGPAGVRRAARAGGDALAELRHLRPASSSSRPSRAHERVGGVPGLREVRAARLGARRPAACALIAPPERDPPRHPALQQHGQHRASSRRATTAARLRQARRDGDDADRGRLRSTAQHAGGLVDRAARRARDSAPAALPGRTTCSAARATSGTVGRNYVELDPARAPATSSAVRRHVAHRCSALRSHRQSTSQGDQGQPASRLAGPPGADRRQCSRPIRLVQGRDHLRDARARRSTTANGDGIGDFRGLIREARLPRSGSASTAIWLLPFYPSPLRDDGYDIADYQTVHPRLRDARGLPARSSRRRTRAASA